MIEFAKLRKDSTIRRNHSKEEDGILGHEFEGSLSGAEQNRRVDVVYQPLSVRFGECDDHHRKQPDFYVSKLDIGSVADEL